MKNNNISPFQIGVFIACGIGIVFAVLIFSDKIKIGGKTDPAQLGGSLVMWGTLPLSGMSNVKDTVTATYKNVQLQYVQKNPATFQQELVNAIASGKGPDLITITPAEVIQNKDRLTVVPFASLPQSLFASTFIDQGLLFLNQEGTLAFPFVVDPLVMYYNQDMLTSSFTVSPPKTWDDIVAFVNKVTQKDDGGALLTQAVAMGTYQNITHAKELLLTLMFQAGNPVVTWGPVEKKYISVFSRNDSTGGPSAASALRFYTDFAKSTNTDRYSWNNELPNDKNQFIAGKLAIYFGFASEIESIRQKNPNLNFNVTMMPQRSTGNRKATYGNLHAVAVLKSSKNTSLALTVAQTIVKTESVTAYLADQLFSAPARRDMLTPKNDDALQTMVYNSAIISQGFLDPDAMASDEFFKRFVTQVNSGLTTPDTIVSTGDSFIRDLLEKNQD